MKPENPLDINPRFILLALGVITFAGNMFLTTKIWKLWPILISMFFSFMDIYIAVYSILNQFIS
jgi:hypothetical protein